MFFRRLNGKYEIDATLRPIVAGCPARFEFLTTDYDLSPFPCSRRYFRGKCRLPISEILINRFSSCIAFGIR